jgi:hypothetical protein
MAGSRTWDEESGEDVLQTRNDIAGRDVVFVERGGFRRTRDWLLRAAEAPAARADWIAPIASSSKKRAPQEPHFRCRSLLTAIPSARRHVLTTYFNWSDPHSGQGCGSEIGASFRGDEDIEKANSLQFNHG